MVFIGITISLLTAVYELLTQQRGIVWVSYGIVNPILLLLPRIIYYRGQNIKERVAGNWVKRIELFGALIILLNAPGSLFLHDMGIQYDRFLHFMMGMFGIFITYMIIYTFYKKPEANKKQILIWSGVSILLGLFLFEWWQFTADRLFGSQLFFDTEQNIKTDFWEDIVFGMAGLISGLFLVKNFPRIFTTKGRGK